MKWIVLPISLLVVGCDVSEYQTRACSEETYVWSIDDEVARFEIPNWGPVMCRKEFNEAKHNAQVIL